MLHRCTIFHPRHTRIISVRDKPQSPLGGHSSPQLGKKMHSYALSRTAGEIAGEEKPIYTVYISSTRCITHVDFELVEAEPRQAGLPARALPVDGQPVSQVPHAQATLDHRPRVEHLRTSFMRVRWVFSSLPGAVCNERSRKGQRDTAACGFADDVREIRLTGDFCRARLQVQRPRQVTWVRCRVRCDRRVSCRIEGKTLLPNDFFFARSHR